MATKAGQFTGNPLGPASPSYKKLLFHYTTIAGLMGIIESKSLWASQIQYLNDSLEFNPAIDIARKNIENPSWIGKSEDYEFLLPKMANDLGFAEDLKICVCSFSEEGDLLSQWRAY
jgi:hypothetical protein